MYHNKLRQLLIFAFLVFISTPAFAIEVVTDFETESVPIVNEILRANDIAVRDNTTDIATNVTDVAAIDARVTTLEAGDDFVNLGAGSELTIAAGEITVTTSYHTVDTQSDDAADDLDKINGGSKGDILVLQSANSGRDTTVKDSWANIRLASGTDFVFTDAEDKIFLIFSSTWTEISRSDNS